MMNCKKQKTQASTDFVHEFCNIQNLEANEIYLGSIGCFVILTEDVLLL